MMRTDVGERPEESGLWTIQPGSGGGASAAGIVVVATLERLRGDGVFSFWFYRTCLSRTRGEHGNVAIPA